MKELDMGLGVQLFYTIHEFHLVGCEHDSN